MTFVEINKKVLKHLKDAPAFEISVKSSEKDKGKVELLSELLNFVLSENIKINYKILHKSHKEAGAKFLYSCEQCWENLRRQILYGQN